MDTAEFKQRFIPLNQRLYRVAWALTHNVQDAEDLVQDAYCRMWRRRNDLSNIDNDEAYCVRLLKNLYCDRLRTASARATDIGPPDDLALSADDDQQLEMERIEAAQQMRQIIERLPDNQRIIITRRDLQDQKFADIATELHMGEGTVRVLLSRARQKLKEQLKLWNNDNRTNQ